MTVYVNEMYRGGVIGVWNENVYNTYTWEHEHYVGVKIHKAWPIYVCEYIQ